MDNLISYVLCLMIVCWLVVMNGLMLWLGWVRLSILMSVCLLVGFRIGVVICIIEWVLLFGVFGLECVLYLLCSVW